MSKHQRAVRTPAIILSRRDFGEADRLLTVLTPRNGKVDAIAYGARKPTSRKTGHVELFTLADMVLNLRREPGVVSQVEQVEPYLPLREDITRSAYASYAAELLDRFTETGDEDLHADLFALLRDTLKRLCVAADPRLSLRYYELHLFDLVGFRPELQTCVLSGATIQPEAQYFSFADGGVVCASVGANNPTLASISLNALKLLRYMQRSPYAQVASLTISDALHSEVEALLLGYATYLLEHRLQSAEFIRRLRQL